MPSEEAVARFRAALIPWYRECARVLPWRRDADPYRVWVSEIMLQQTRVEAVLDHYERFLLRFPTVEVLASASEEEVLEAWSGLGYYRRARSLLAGARVVVADHGGTFPEDETAALALPGIGRYTAGAIRSIAYGIRAPILDGNVVRVLSRVFGIAGDPTKAQVSRVLWAMATDMVREGEPAVVNQAQMELGALVCTPASPRCEVCPIADACVARREARIDELPARPPKRASVDVLCAVLVVRAGDRLLLRRRPPGELLPGLWDLPGAFAGANGDEDTGLDEVVESLPFPVVLEGRLGAHRHGITYRRLTLEVHAATADPSAAEHLQDAGGAELWWGTRTEAAERALSSPARKILRKWGSLAPRDP